MSLFQQILEEWSWYRYMDGGESFWKAFREPGFYISSVYRFGHRVRLIRTPVLGTFLRLCYALCKLVVFVVTGAQVRPGAHIGKRFSVHTCQGIIIAGGVRIGDDCIVNSGVCIVHRANNRGEGVPQIGNHVRISVGAKILGNVTIGDHAVIGANAVVLHDVPPYSMAVGVPAIVKPLPSHMVPPTAAAGKTEPSDTLPAESARNEDFTVNQS